MYYYVDGDVRVYQIVNSFYASNTFIITVNGSRAAWLVDCGDDEAISEYVEANNITLQGIFITHGHYDHIYGLNKVRAKFGDVPIYTNDEGKENLYNTRYNFSKFHESDFVLKGENIRVISNKSLVTLFDKYDVEVFSTPGHDWSCLTYKLGNLVFTGDSYIPGLKTVTSFPKSNKQQAEKSMQTIVSLFQEQTIICPGHGPVITYNN